MVLGQAPLQFEPRFFRRTEPFPKQKAAARPTESDLNSTPKNRHHINNYKTQMFNLTYDSPYKEHNFVTNTGHVLLWIICFALSLSFSHISNCRRKIDRLNWCHRLMMPWPETSLRPYRHKIIQYLHAWHGTLANLSTYIQKLLSCKTFP